MSTFEDQRRALLNKTVQGAGAGQSSQVIDTDVAGDSVGDPGAASFKQELDAIHTGGSPVNNNSTQELANQNFASSAVTEPKAKGGDIKGPKAPLTAGQTLGLQVAGQAIEAYFKIDDIRDQTAAKINEIDRGFMIQFKDSVQSGRLNEMAIQYKAFEDMMDSFDSLKKQGASASTGSQNQLFLRSPSNGRLV